VTGRRSPRSPPDSLYEPDFELELTHEDPDRPDSLYGTSKASGEAIGRQYVEESGDRPPGQRRGVGRTTRVTFRRPVGVAGPFRHGQTTGAVTR